jgi:hypothetical protein
MGILDHADPLANVRSGQIAVERLGHRVARDKQRMQTARGGRLCSKRFGCEGGGGDRWVLARGRPGAATRKPARSGENFERVVLLGAERSADALRATRTHTSPEHRPAKPLPVFSDGLRQKAGASVGRRRDACYDDKLQPSRFPDVALRLLAKQEPAGGGSAL